MQRELAWAECELAAYQRGFLFLRLDFQHNVLVWKDSNRWFNNFVRGLPREKMAGYREIVSDFIRQASPEPDLDLEKIQRDFIWRLSYQEVDGSEEFELTGSDLSSLPWQKLAAAFAEAAGRSFSL